MQPLKIYKVDNKYINYLHSRDNKVQYNKNNKRPYVGIVFTFAGYQYFVPMESPKPNHSNVKSGKHIMLLNGGNYGLLGFNNMIPVHKDALIPFDINSEEDEKYRRLLQRQATVCNRNKSDIFDHAQKTYFDVVNGKNKFLIGISCNFKKLEFACKTYNPNYRAVKNIKKKTK